MRFLTVILFHHSNQKYCNPRVTIFSKSPLGIIPWGVMWLFRIIFIGTFQRDYRPVLFSSFEPAWALDQWVKIFTIFSISQSYLNKKNKKFPGVLYCGESISLGHHKAGSHPWPQGFNSHFLKLLHNFEGIVSQKLMWIRILLIKGYVFHFA